MAFDHSTGGYAIRRNIADAHRAVWGMIGEPGCWWRGEDRIAFVAEARNARACAACRKRREALSPKADCGPHNATTHRPDAVVDAVHRVTTDPARLSRSWLDGLNAAGVTDEQYVELLGVVVAAISIDAFHRALGLPPKRLPTPTAGSPSGYRPSGAADSGAWVPTVQPEQAGEAEADLYPGGRTGNVISALSLVPDSVRMLLRLSDAHYLPLGSIRTPNDNADSALTQDDIEPDMRLRSEPLAWRRPIRIVPAEAFDCPGNPIRPSRTPLSKRIHDAASRNTRRSKFRVLN